MYGETMAQRSVAGTRQGLSPHVRGNPQCRSIASSFRRSIPACTGKPRSSPRCPGPAGVYPRMYGETVHKMPSFAALVGLSPHVRGNRGGAQRVYLPVGSIPACTGKPGCVRGRRQRAGVYPRMYGETTTSARSGACGTGLSPHVRGNPRPRNRTAPGRRSIPACTGKPLGQNDPLRKSYLSKTDEPATVTRSPYGESDATPAARPATLDAWEPEWRWTRPRMRS